MAKAKTKTTAKSKAKAAPARASSNTIDAEYILHRHEQQQQLDEAEKRFYTAVVWKLGDESEIASEEEEEAARIVAEKGGYDLVADVKAIQSTIRYWHKLGGPEPALWEENIRLASIAAQDAGEAHKATEERCNAELQQARAKAIDASFKVRALASSKVELEKLQANQPHLFTENRGGQ